MTTTATGSLTMIGLNTPTPKVFWNGSKVDGITGILVDNEAGTCRVVLKMPEDSIITELRTAGVIVKREAV